MRQGIYDRAKELIKLRADQAQKKADEIRSGTRYAAPDKAGGGAAVADPLGLR